MSAHSQFSPTSQASPAAIDSSLPSGHARKRSMSRTQKILFFATGWLIVLMPFLFWWNTWFGRRLSDQQLNEYLHDTKKPRHIQQALVQVGERMTRHDGVVAQWYPELIVLAANPVEEIRNTDAWVMGQDTSRTDFHEALLKMLNDSSPMVRGNAALSLVRFGDATGRPQIVALLEPAHITAPEAGRIVDADRTGTAIRQNGLIAKLALINISASQSTIEIRSPIAGRIRSVVGTGANVAAGAEVGVIDPATEQVWEALRALYLVGQVEDIPAIRPYERELPDVSNDVRQQALETAKAVQARAE
jgi:HEAT repeat protein